VIVIERTEEVTIPEKKYFNPENNEFIVIPEMTLKPILLKLEHSLISIRNWEAENGKPFCELQEMTPEELMSYIRCMTVNHQKDESVYDSLTGEEIQRIVLYITRINSAWKIKPDKDKKGKKPKDGKPHTVESIYYAMAQLGIPFVPCEQWHLGSLMALIDYFAQMSEGVSQKEKPKNMRELRESWHRINEANKKKYHSRG